MLWPWVTGLTLLIAVLLHWWWRRRWREARRATQDEIDRLRREQQQLVRQLQGRQEAIFDSMTEALVLLDAGGRIQLVNRAFHTLFGVTDDVRARTLLEALRLHELDELVQTLEKQAGVVGRELHLTRPGDCWLQVNSTAIVDGNGQRQGTLLVFHDLTRLKQLEGARQEFVANVSHELRTPLSLIKGYVETLLEGARNDPEVAVKFLQTIDRNAERLRLLIEDLLSISELESGRVKLNLQQVELRPLVSKVLSELGSRASARQVRLVSSVPEVSARADAARLEQVLVNLVDNAIKYGRAGGAVTVTAQHAEDQQIEVCVQDDGPGIPPESLDRIFERFYRVDKARSRDQGGTGLGLSIVKHIVQNHGGRVWVRSEVGQGSSFYFTLP